MDPVQEDTKGGGLTEHEAPLRPTRHRLFIAMGVAACFVSLLLALLELIVDLAANTPKPNAVSGQSLTVRIRPNEADSKSELASGEQSAKLQLREDLSLTEIPIPRQETTSASPPESPPDLQPVMDWREMITETVATIGNENLRQEKSRSSMRRQTHSIMFQPASEIVLKEPDPIIPDFRFKPQVHVAGIGVTIGSCFIGLPIVGVPVEDRTAAIRLFVCAQDSN